MLKRLIFLLLVASLGSAQNLMPPVPPAFAVKKYHGTKLLKGATLLKTKLVILKPLIIWLTWQPNYTVPGEVTVIEQSPDLKHWAVVFRGATNRCPMTVTGLAEFWRAYNSVP